MPRTEKKKKGAQHDPLHVDILNTKQIVKPKTKQQQQEQVEQKQPIDSKTSKKILQSVRTFDDEDDWDQDDEEQQQQQVELGDEEADEVFPEGDEQVEDVVLDEQDAQVLNAFFSAPTMNTNQAQQPTIVLPDKNASLADIILQKIREKEQVAGKSMELSNTEQDVENKLPGKVVAAYKKIGQMLAKYKTGQVPKAFKVIPSLLNWEEVLLLTKPDNWTHQSFFRATKLFAANLNPKMAQRFYSMVLLPRMRHELDEHGKLNVHLYQALRKACFKPAAFFKGIVLPLVESGSCTLKEANVLSSVIKKTSIPMLHSSAALLKLVTLQSTASMGATTMFVKVLIEKSYALPTKVIHAVVDYFYQYAKDERVMPVIWHQTLLSFVKIYRQDMTREHKNKLFEVCRKHSHHSITQEIRKELTSVGNMLKQQAKEQQQDDAVNMED